MPGPAPSTFEDLFDVSQPLPKRPAAWELMKQQGDSLRADIFDLLARSHRLGGLGGELDSPGLTLAQISEKLRQALALEEVTVSGKTRIAVNLKTLATREPGETVTSLLDLAGTYLNKKNPNPSKAALICRLAYYLQHSTPLDRARVQQFLAHLKFRGEMFGKVTAPIAKGDSVSVFSQLQSKLAETVTRVAPFKEDKFEALSLLFRARDEMDKVKDVKEYAGKIAELDQDILFLLGCIYRDSEGREKFPKEDRSRLWDEGNAYMRKWFPPKISRDAFDGTYGDKVALLPAATTERAIVRVFQTLQSSEVEPVGDWVVCAIVAKVLFDAKTALRFFVKHKTDGSDPWFNEESKIVELLNGSLQFLYEALTEYENWDWKDPVAAEALKNLKVSVAPLPLLQAYLKVALAMSQYPAGLERIRQQSSDWDRIKTYWTSDETAMSQELRLFFKVAEHYRKFGGGMEMAIKQLLPHKEKSGDTVVSDIYSFPGLNPNDSSDAQEFKRSLAEHVNLEKSYHAAVLDFSNLFDLGDWGLFSRREEALLLRQIYQLVSLIPFDTKRGHALQNRLPLREEVENEFFEGTKQLLQKPVDSLVSFLKSTKGPSNQQKFFDLMTYCFENGVMQPTQLSAIHPYTKLYTEWMHRYKDPNHGFDQLIRKSFDMTVELMFAGKNFTRTPRQGTRDEKTAVLRYYFQGVRELLAKEIQETFKAANVAEALRTLANDPCNYDLYLQLDSALAEAIKSEQSPEGLPSFLLLRAAVNRWLIAKNSCILTDRPETEELSAIAQAKWNFYQIVSTYWRCLDSKSYDLHNLSDREVQTRLDSLEERGNAFDNKMLFDGDRDVIQLLQQVATVGANLSLAKKTIQFMPTAIALDLHRQCRKSYIQIATWLLKNDSWDAHRSLFENFMSAQVFDESDFDSIYKSLQGAIQHLNLIKQTVLTINGGNLSKLESEINALPAIKAMWVRFGDCLTEVDSGSSKDQTWLNLLTAIFDLQLDARTLDVGGRFDRLHEFMSNSHRPSGYESDLKQIMSEPDSVIKGLLLDRFLRIVLDHVLEYQREKIQTDSIREWNVLQKVYMAMDEFEGRDQLTTYLSLFDENMPEEEYQIHYLGFCRLHSEIFKANAELADKTLPLISVIRDDDRLVEAAKNPRYCTSAALHYARSKEALSEDDLLSLMNPKRREGVSFRNYKVYFDLFNAGKCDREEICLRLKDASGVWEKAYQEAQKISTDIPLVSDLDANALLSDPLKPFRQAIFSIIQHYGAKNIEAAEILTQQLMAELDRLAMRAGALLTDKSIKKLHKPLKEFQESIAQEKNELADFYDFISEVSGEIKGLRGEFLQTTVGSLVFEDLEYVKSWGIESAISRALVSLMSQDDVTANPERCWDLSVALMAHNASSLQCRLFDRWIEAFGEGSPEANAFQIAKRIFQLDRESPKPEDRIEVLKQDFEWIQKVERDSGSSVFMKAVEKLVGAWNSLLDQDDLELKGLWEKLAGENKDDRMLALDGLKQHFAASGKINSL